MTETQCDCQKCRAMCEHSTCLPTPQEVVRLIGAGHAARLQCYRFEDGRSYVAPSIVGRATSVLPRTDLGRCVFYRDGCALHAAGLKPYEGRIAHHERDRDAVRWDAVRQWRVGDYAYISDCLREAH